ncbi:GNAT family N-acetyltransferase [Blastococcus sp. HT6-30]|uniref:GNAT family N-acetyltransferase n=1 Tax=Blastococcus sp. HT6-30 TaxID=3144843 RepID=UPI003218EA9B
MSRPVQIREATDADWPAIFPVFRAVVDAGETYTHPAGLSSDEARALWMAPPPGRTVVAVDGDSVLGTAKAGPDRPGRGSHVVTASFMVGPAAQGRGVGRALGEHVVGWARAAGYRSIQFDSVVETNAPAVRLWRSLGFRILTTVPEAFDHPEPGYVGLHGMYLDLTAG